MSSHALHEFVDQVSAEMAAEYERIRAHAAEDPGTAGDEGEGNWASLLREWLPSTYHVTTKGRLLSADGQLSPQVDVVVLRASYPPKLLEKKTYLAGGVAAAFECKTTLTAAHLTKATETAAVVRRLVPTREGSAYRELFSPLAFGVLAHSHSWKSANSTPRQNITAALRAADAKYVAHPRETLDLVTVADLGTWRPWKIAGLSNSLFPLEEEWETVRTVQGFPPEGGVGTSVMEPTLPATGNGAEDGRPIGAMLAQLTETLAREDVALRPIAEYFAEAGLFGASGGAFRVWPWDVYSDATRARATAGQLENVRWSEWSIVF